MEWRLTRAIESPIGQDFSYEYDYLDRLMKRKITGGADQETFQYNWIGNITQKNGGAAWVYGSKPHAVSNDGSESYVYDGNGNMVQRGASQYLKYDAENRLVKVSSDAGGTVYIARFAYDGDGRRVKRLDNNGTIHYVGPHYERNVGTGIDTTETVTKFYYAANRLIAFRKNGTLYYVCTDHLGGTRQVIDAQGNEAGYVRYQSYGADRESGGSLNTDKKFTSQTSDASTGLYYYGARYYDPYLNRFVQPDTIVPGAANPQALNRYSYVLNSPLRYADPTGHAGQDLQYLEPNWFDEQWQKEFEQVHGRLPTTEADYLGRFVGMALANNYAGEDIARYVTIAMSAGATPTGRDLWSRPVDSFGALGGLGNPANLDQPDVGIYSGIGDLVNFGLGFEDYRWGNVRIVTNAGGAVGTFVRQLGGGGDNATTFSATLMVFTSKLNFNSPRDIWWLEHELWHVRQAQLMGLGYLPTYIDYARQLDHAHNPLEMAANSFANQGGTGVVRWD